MEFSTKEQLQQALENDHEGLLEIDGTQYQGKDSDFERVFIDNFDATGPWVIGESDAYLCTIEAGYYYFQHKIDHEQAFYNFVPMAVIKADKNWGIESSIDILDLPENSGFGLILGKSQQGFSGSSFLLNSNTKQFWISHNNGEQSYSIVNARYCSQINEKQNKLRVEHLNGYWQYFINDHLVYLSPVQALYGDGFGFAYNGRGSLRADYFKIHW